MWATLTEVSQHVASVRVEVPFTVVGISEDGIRAGVPVDPRVSARGGVPGDGGEQNDLLVLLSFRHSLAGALMLGTREIVLGVASGA